MIQHEWNFQKAAFVYLQKALPPHALVWGSDSAGKKTRWQRIGEARRGIKAGIHDLFAWCDGKLMTFELKQGRNTATDNQENFARGVVRNGGRSFVCWTLEDIEAGLIACGFKPRAHLTAAERDARLAAPKSPRKYKPRTVKPAASRVRRVQAIMDGLHAREELFTGVKR